MIQNARRGIADLKEDRKQRTVPGIGLHTHAQRFGIFKWRQGAVDVPQHVPEEDLLGRTLELITAVGAANAHHEPGTLEVPQDGLQKLFRQGFLLGDVVDLHGAAWVLPSKHDEGLQGVKSFLSDPHAG